MTVETNTNFRCSKCDTPYKFDIDGTMQGYWCPRCTPRDPFEHAATIIRGVLP